MSLAGHGDGVGVNYKNIKLSYGMNHNLSIKKFCIDFGSGYSKSIAGEWSRAFDSFVRFHRCFAAKIVSPPRIVQTENKKTFISILIIRILGSQSDFGKVLQ